MMNKTLVCFFTSMLLTSIGLAGNDAYYHATGKLELKAIAVTGANNENLGDYDAQLSLKNNIDIILELDSAQQSTTTSSTDTGNFVFSTGVLELPNVHVQGINYAAQLSMTNTDPMQFSLNQISHADKQVPACDENAPGITDIINGPDGPDNVADFDSVFRSLTVSPDNDNYLLMGTERNGFVKSTDGGVTWSRLRTGLRYFEGTNNYPEIWDISFHPENDNVIYSATLDSPGPVTGDYPSSMGGVYKSIDQGDTWFRANCGLTNSRATAIAVNQVESNIILLGIEGETASFSQLANQFFDGGLYRSTDDGCQWQLLNITENDATNGFWRILSYGTGDSFITFGHNRNDLSKNVGFVRSTDGGKSWQQFAQSLRQKLIAWYSVSNDGQTIYAVAQDSFEIQKSMDGGETWDSINAQVNGPIEVSPSNEQVVLFAQTTSLRKSNAGGANSYLVLEAAQSIHDIVYAPSNPNIVYVATQGYNIYKSIDGGESFQLLVNIRNDVL